MIAVLLAKMRSNDPLIATVAPSSGPATWAPRSEMNWLVSEPAGSRVVDQRVSSGLVSAIVAMTPAIVRYATWFRGCRMAGAIWAIDSRPEKARKAAA